VRELLVAESVGGVARKVGVGVANRCRVRDHDRVVAALPERSVVGPAETPGIEASIAGTGPSGDETAEIRLMQDGNFIALVGPDADTGVAAAEAQGI